ncbi:MAG TPA: ATPase, partial [Syntrophomonadaceae bacterium]|nr:ATPase [Syntrophomonadaceae bacterium]
IDKVMMGEKIDRKPSDEERYRIAVHETGHALISEFLRKGSVSHLTVTTRGRALGYMRSVPEDDLYLYTKEHLEEQIQICLAGAAAENVVLGSQSTGASNDFQQAVNIARQIITAGLSSLGVICEEIIPQERYHQELQKIIKEQEEKVHQILQDSCDTLKEIAELLMEQEYISGDELRNMLEQGRVIH